MRIAFTHNLQHDHDDEAQAEFDRQETVDAIVEAIASLGHDVTPIDVGGSPAQLISRLEAARPDLVFNTAEGTHGRTREAFYPGLFDQLGLPFTGSDAYVCAVTLDKQLSKMAVAQRGVPTPKWRFIDADQLGSGHELDLADLQFPVIVKPNFEGSSKGITQDSVVAERTHLLPYLRTILARYPSGVLIEEFITGRDVVVPFLEALSDRTEGVLSPVSYRFDERITGKRKHEIYDYDLKCVNSDAVTVECPAPLPPEVNRELLEVSKRAFRALGIRDLGRIDYRVTPDGRVYFLEVNALPSLEPGAGIYLAAALAGAHSTPDVLGAVIESASRRHHLRAGPSPFRRRALKVGLAYNLKRVVAKTDKDDDRDAEYDSQATIDALAAAIASHGHRVVRLEADASIAQALPAAGVDLVFNLSEGQRGRSRESLVPALCEHLGIPFTGSDATTMAVALDKALCKAVVGAAGVPTGAACVMKSGDEPLPAGLAFPVIVKPNAEGSSKGVLPRSVVEDERALRATVREMAQRYHQDVLVEEYLPGREFTVAMLGQGPTPRILPPMEIVYTSPDTKHPIYAFGDKLDWTTKIRYDRPARVDDALAREIAHVATAVWRALGCKDVVRVDLRQDARGRLCFIEANPLPGITPGWSDLCLIADSAQLPYEALIGEILASAVQRAEAVVGKRSTLDGSANGKPAARAAMGGA